ncbi:hypothetical protein [Hymenobacter terrenus]|uniref:hypothetical protein n=1 Tax=Hymenobacter terrenus TaxID=1629124 RepID=UPI000619479A|nr:hypothetical protein [Hymenobacter terrenus]
MQTLVKSSLFMAMLGLSLSACQKQADPQPAALQTQATADAKGEFTLRGGETLYWGQYLQSKNGQYRLVMQGDGNAVFIRVADKAILWKSGTAGNPNARLTVKTTGDVVISSASNVTLLTINGDTGAGGYGKYTYIRNGWGDTGYSLDVDDSGSLYLLNKINQFGAGILWIYR